MNKKLFLLVLWVMAAFMPAVAQQTITVYDGTDNNSYVPIYGLYCDNYLKCEYVIPASELEDMTGATIDKLTWYLKQVAGGSWGTANFQIFLKEVNAATLSAYSGVEGATIVYEGALDGTTAEMNIQFTTPYVYNGGNLLVGVYNTVKGDWKSAYFYGQTVSGQCVQGYSGSSLEAVTVTARSFVPKTTFTYTPGSGPICYKPKNVAASDVVYNGATITWTPGDEDQDAWEVVYGTGDVDPETATPIAVSGEPTYALTGLAASTTYKVFVRSNCSEDLKSGWTSVYTFTTPDQFVKPSALTVTDITANTAKVTWEAGGDETNWNVQYKKAADEEWTSAGTVNEKTITLDALANSTNYEVRVQGNFGDDNVSDWTSTTFTTLRCDDMGQITYQLTDSYGDGWNGAQIQVQDVEGNVLETLTISTGASATGTVGICLGETLNFVWKAGSYDTECSFTITDPFNEVIFECAKGGAPSTGQFASYTYAEITCKKPTALAASNVVYNGATLTWTAGDEEQDAWQVLCAPGEFDPDAIELIPTDVTGEATLALTGLTENTTYSAYVRGNCGENDKSAWSEVCTFTTPEQFPAPEVTIDNITAKSANAIWEGNAESYKLRYRTKASFEKFFFESFESTPSGWTANEWSLTNISSSTMGGVPLAAADGNYCIASCSVDANYDYLNYADTLISPQVDLKGNLILYAADLGEGFEESFSVYVSTSGTEAANFTPLGENIPTPGEVPTSSDKWGKHSFDLSAYEGQQGYIAIVHNRTGNSGYYLFIDAVTIAGADIPAGEWVIIDPATSPQALEGLTPSTTYEVEVQAVYADGASQWSEPVEFTTLAADANPNAVEVTDVTDKSAKVNVEGSQDTYNIRYRTAASLNQINEDFETMTTGSNPPEGWTMIDADGDGYCWYGWAPANINDSQGNPTVLGTAAITSASYMSMALTPDDWLITPKVNLGGTVSFMYRGQDPSYPAEHFGVYVSVAGNTSPDDFVAVSAETEATAIYTELTVDLSAYEGQQGYIAIRHFNCSDEFRLNIDNFVYNNNDKENVPAGEWTVVEGVEVPYTIEGLDPETEYEVQVQGVVDEQNTTEWTASEFFTTLEYIPEYGEFYLVGTFNDWNQLEDGGRIELLANADATEYSAPVTLAQGDRFKIITFDKDGNMIWIGAESNGNFLVLPEYYGSTPITLIFGDEGKDFEMQEGGNFKITVKAAPVEEPAEPSGIAPKAVAEPLVMVIDKITGIETIDINNAGSNEWYNLNGQKLNGKPTVPGIYINGHRKVIVK